jgi:hypothetical protein
MTAVAVVGCSGTADSPETSTTPVVDASHPPAPLPNGQSPAPAGLATPLLTPGDLGPTWRVAETPPVTYGTPQPFAVGPPAVYQLHAHLQTEHWTGSAWLTDQYVEELAQSYGTASNASQTVILQVAQGKGAYHPKRISGVKVWIYASTQASAARLAWLAVGPLAVKLTIGPPAAGAPGVVPVDRMIRIAVDRLKAHPASPRVQAG